MTVDIPHDQSLDPEDEEDGSNQRPPPVPTAFDNNSPLVLKLTEATPVVSKVFDKFYTERDQIQAIPDETD